MVPDAELEAVRARFRHRLERPLEALATLRQTRSTLERLERMLVGEARGNYSTWEEIGRALGMSRQAAHRRHGRFVSRMGGVWHESDTGHRVDERTRLER